MSIVNNPQLIHKHRITHAMLCHTSIHTYLSVLDALDNVGGVERKSKHSDVVPAHFLDFTNKYRESETSGLQKNITEFLDMATTMRIQNRADVSVYDKKRMTNLTYKGAAISLSTIPNSAEYSVSHTSLTPSFSPRQGPPPNHHPTSL